jgi:hypothetical protein
MTVSAACSSSCCSKCALLVTEGAAHLEACRLEHLGGVWHCGIDAWQHSTAANV